MLRLIFETDYSKADKLYSSSGNKDDEDLTVLFNLTDNDFDINLRLLYNKIAFGYVAENTGDYRQLMSIPNYNFPVKEVKLDEDNEKIKIVFDENLFNQLLEIYVFYGWPGILIVKTAIGSWELVSDPESGGVLYPKPSAQQVSAYNFFINTIKIISLLICNALVEIEQKSNKLILTKINASMREAQSAIDKYGLFPAKVPAKKRDRKNYRPYERKKSIDPAKEKYIIEAENLLQDAYKHKNNIDATLKKYARIFQEEKIREPQSRIPGMEMTPYSETENAEALLKNIESEQEHFQELLFELKEKDPLFLLPLNSMGPNVTDRNFIALFESELGRILYSTKKEQQKMLGLIVEKEKFIKETFSFLTKPGVNIKNIELADASIESFVIKKAFKAECYSLLSERILELLVSEELVQKNSFAYPALFHYKNELKDYLQTANENKERSENNIKKIVSTIGLLSSALSLLAAATSQLEIASVVTSITESSLAKKVAYLLIVNDIYSTYNNLEEFEKQVNNATIGIAEAEKGEYLKALSGLTEIVQLQREYKNELTTNLVLMVIEMMLGQKTNDPALAEMQSLIKYKNYYNDIETLYGAL